MEPPCKDSRIGRGRVVRVRSLIRRVHQLECQLAQCEQARLKLVLRMRHDLLGPVNTLSGFLELLAEERVGSLTATQRAWVANMRAAADHLLSLVETAAKQKEGP
jgi:signal transduction histidine kinase